MFKFLIIFAIIFVNVKSVPVAKPNADIFDIFDDIYDYFFESDEDLSFENQTVTINCKNCTVKVNNTGEQTMLTTVAPITTTLLPTNPPVPTTVSGPAITLPASPVTTSMAPPITVPSTAPTMTVPTMEPITTVPTMTPTITTTAMASNTIASNMTPPTPMNR